MTSRRVLTGITTTGTPHLGNYVGAIRPAIAASRRSGMESFFFLADYHALIKASDPDRIARSTLEIAASWLALGLDTQRVHFYRQSDIPEIPELTWLLTCVTAKGLLNRAHAYKAAVDQNLAAGEDADAGVTAGLYQYPVLMAADILLFRAHEVPVGRDQVQHIEIARDIAQRFNHLYGAEHFVLPEASVEEHVAVLPGLDGRKMSKSYDNTIPLWLDAKALRKAVLGIVTNSLGPGAPKDPDDSHLFQIYRAFATAEESASMREAYGAGIAWGEAKEQLFALIDRELAAPRQRYHALVANPREIELTLEEGAARVRDVARPFIRELRRAVGLRALGQVESGASKSATPKAGAGKRAAFKTFRERDGRFHFRLVDADGASLVVSTGFASPAETRAAQDALLATPPEQRRRNAIAGAPCEGGVRVELMLAGDQPLAFSEALVDANAARDCLDRIELALGEIAAASEPAAS
jgi:tryptophanyl-tRNA synthetase